jgi:hypothetical protein
MDLQIFPEVLETTARCCPEVLEVTHVSGEFAKLLLRNVHVEPEFEEV